MQRPSLLTSCLWLKRPWCWKQMRLVVVVMEEVVMLLHMASRTTAAVVLIMVFITPAIIQANIMDLTTYSIAEELSTRTHTDIWRLIQPQLRWRLRLRVKSWIRLKQPRRGVSDVTFCP